MRPSTWTLDAVLEQVFLAEPDLDFWIIPNSGMGLFGCGPDPTRWPPAWHDFSRIVALGKDGRFYSRAVCAWEGAAAIRRCARELRGQLDKVAKRHGGKR